MGRQREPSVKVLFVSKPEETHENIIQLTYSSGNRTHNALTVTLYDPWLRLNPFLNLIRTVDERKVEITIVVTKVLMILKIRFPVVMIVINMS